MPTPEIYASTDNGYSYSNEGVYLYDGLAEKVTFTCRAVLFPDKSQYDDLTSAEQYTMASRWIDVIIVLPDNMDAVIFSGGIKQNNTTYTEGVLVKLDHSGTYSFRILNGEIVIWYPDQDEYEYNDLLRILNQVAYGNYDTNRALKLQAISENLVSSIPDEFINADSLRRVSIPSAD